MTPPDVEELLGRLADGAAHELRATDPTLGRAYYSGLVERAEVSSLDDAIRMRRDGLIAIRITRLGQLAAPLRRGPCP